MSDKAIEVISDTVALFMPERDEGQDGRITLKSARDILDALKAAGFEVVKPELGRLSATWLATAQRFPEATRKFGADLVAAADAAEAVHDA